MNEEKAKRGAKKEAKRIICFDIVNITRDDARILKNTAEELRKVTLVVRYDIDKDGAQICGTKSELNAFVDNIHQRKEDSRFFAMISDAVRELKIGD